ncbi:chromate transporter [Ileibacterium valens]|uniref:chromate transporter n=1 Tax=Ileibacterium valens TaxID=1862668 RepID=UPI0023568711|nr:chromate transporter [Ileibacterium valens]
MNIYLDLFLTFFKIGLFTFGGGYAMLPMLESEVVNKKHWATYDELMDYFAVGQCTPGVIAVNTATFVGYNKKRISGGLAATAGVITPSIIIIIIIASLLTNFASIPAVQHALSGIRIAVCVLIFKAVLKMMKSGIQDAYGIGIFIAALAATYFELIPTVLIVVIAGTLGVLIKNILKSNKEKPDA